MSDKREQADHIRSRALVHSTAMKDCQSCQFSCQLNPLTREEVAALLETVKAKAPRCYPLFLCAVRTGLRMGELLALRWEDLDFHGRFIAVSRSYTHWQITTPKSGESRRVDMSRELTQTLKDLLLERKVDAGANGTPRSRRGCSVARREGSCTPTTFAIASSTAS